MSKKLSNIYTGTVVAIKKNNIAVDLRLKCLYFVNIDEFSEEEREDLINKQISVYVPNIDPLVNTNRYASYKKAKIEVLWKQIEMYKKLDKIIGCKIINATRGGYSVLLNIGINAFLPSSHINNVVNQDLVGTYIDVKIIGTNKIHKNIVVSRKEVIFSEIEDQNTDSISGIKPGVMLLCLIKGINSSGLFVSVGHGYSGFIGLHDATYQYDADLSKTYQIGQVIQASILEVDDSNKRLTLTCLSYQDNPFEKYSIGDVVYAIPVSIICDESADFIALMREREYKVLCKMISLDSRFTFDELSEMIKSKTAIECKIKHVNIENKNLIVTTHRSNAEIWSAFYQEYSKCEDKTMQFVVHRKSRFMIFAKHNDFEITIPITSVHYIDTQKHFDSINIKDTIRAKAIHIDEKEMSAVFSIRAIYASQVENTLQEIVNKKIVNCVAKYFLSERRVVVLIENKLEVSAKTNKIDPYGHIDYNKSFNLEVEYHNVENLHIELRSIQQNKDASASSMTSLSILDIMGVEIEDLCE